jgi:1-aminocyclopropane-1-carboxylate deaminase/D-cysteine desulfhydrase-like pyridoxal-dependent ACC family enzyme
MTAIPLFERYPLLRERLSHVALCQLPTPVRRLERLGQELGSGSLYVKRDDLSGTVYGGNKPRKLEFLLADALRAGSKEVITFGCAGSNHALATAIYSREVGLKSISMLMPQPNAHYVRRNLLLSHHYGAELHLCGAELESALNKPLIYLATVRQVLQHRVKRGCAPHLIPPGGSSPVGVVGYVNAAYELAQQTALGELPEPDLIYVACGTMGTAAGLILGLKAAGLRCRVVCVQVTGGSYVNAGGMVYLIDRTSALLHSLDDSFPRFAVQPSEFDVRPGYLGERYAQFTAAGMAAVALMKQSEDIALEGTYTGKTLAAVVNDVHSGTAKEKTVLFWNTVNSRDLSGVASSIDYHDLPHEFHRYFEEEVQPLDRDP